MSQSNQQNFGNAMQAYQNSQQGLASQGMGSISQYASQQNNQSAIYARQFEETKFQNYLMNLIIALQHNVGEIEKGTAHCPNANKIAPSITESIRVIKSYLTNSWSVERVNEFLGNEQEKR